MTTAPATSAVGTTELAGALGLAVTRLHRHLRRQAGGGLTPTQMSALSTIARQGPLTLGELAGAEQVAPPTITKVVAKLGDRGYVTRTVDVDDRRIHRVAMTAAGRRHLEAVRSQRKAWLAERLARISASDRALLMTAVDVMDRLDQPSEAL
ncbi:MAG: MarR family transcriptional regulator [Acidimicrobiales bacterium]